MAKSQARKVAEKLIREGKSDPRTSRLNWNGVNPMTRALPNKKKDYAPSAYSRAYESSCVGL
jgi:hypothetical protein